MKQYEKEKVELIVEDAILRTAKVMSSALSTGQVPDIDAERMAINEAVEWAFETLDREFPDG